MSGPRRRRASPRRWRFQPSTRATCRAFPARARRPPRQTLARASVRALVDAPEMLLLVESSCSPPPEARPRLQHRPRTPPAKAKWSCAKDTSH
ncbi:hypothetical protein ACP4OV_026384 [Aristida adscensionis]